MPSSSLHGMSLNLGLSMQITSHQLWKGNMSVNSIGLPTCWFNGHNQAASLNQEIEGLLDSITNVDGTDMLSPLGSLIIKFRTPYPVPRTASNLKMKMTYGMQHCIPCLCPCLRMQMK